MNLTYMVLLTMKEIKVRAPLFSFFSSFLTWGAIEARQFSPFLVLRLRGNHRRKRVEISIPSFFPPPSPRRDFLGL